MIIEYLVIEKSIAKLNMKNKEVLMTNASSINMVILPYTLSQNAYDTLTRIMRNVFQLSENETLLKKIVQRDDNILPDHFDDMWLDIEKQINADLKNGKLPIGIDIKKIIKDINPQLN